MANTATSRSYRATGIGLLALHLGALAAFVPQFFTWSALGVAVGLYYLTGGIGISLGFHRILTHRSLRCPRWLEYGLAICGTLALQGGPIEWVATHRAHHAHTDREGDPHDVHRGLPWAHVAWLYRKNDARPTPTEQRRLAPDLVRQPFYRFLERTYLLWQVGLAAALFAAGGWPWVVWGIFVRLVVTYHITWLVNSAAHHTGYRFELPQVAAEASGTAAAALAAVIESASGESLRCLPIRGGWTGGRAGRA